MVGGRLKGGLERCTDGAIVIIPEQRDALDRRHWSNGRR